MMLFRMLFLQLFLQLLIEMLVQLGSNTGTIGNYAPETAYSNAGSTYAARNIFLELLLVLLGMLVIMWE